MRLETVLSLSGATLMSQPPVHVFNNIVLTASKVRRGDLFVAYEPDTIPQAIANGAYAVLFETPQAVTDPETAWLKVPSLDAALLRLLRFHLLEKSLKAIACDPLSLAVAAQIVKDERCHVMTGSIKSDLVRLWGLERESFVFFPDRKACRDLFVDAVILPQTDAVLCVSEQTLFEATFSLQGMRFERKPVSPFFLPALNRVCAFLQANGLGFNLFGMSGSTHFAPVFVSEALQIRSFGHSDRVLIFESDPALAAGEIDFMNRMAKWAEKLFIVPETLYAALPQDKALLSYDSKEAIISTLKSVPFHFALIVGQTKNLLDPLQKPGMPTLFSQEILR